MTIAEKQMAVLELDIIYLCNKLSDPSRHYLLDSYVQLGREEFFKVFFAYMTGYINGRDEVTAIWKESHNAIAEIINR
jgi:hypothetical protein